MSDQGPRGDDRLDQVIQLVADAIEAARECAIYSDRPWMAANSADAIDALRALVGAGDEPPAEPEWTVATDGRAGRVGTWTAACSCGYTSTGWTTEDYGTAALERHDCALRRPSAGEEPPAEPLVYSPGADMWVSAEKRERDTMLGQPADLSGSPEEVETDEWPDGWERIARCFHRAYEDLAPEHGYETREESAVPWDQVPLQNRRLMIRTVGHVLRDMQDFGWTPPPAPVQGTPEGDAASEPERWEPTKAEGGFGRDEDYCAEHDLFFTTAEAVDRHRNEMHAAPPAAGTTPPAACFPCEDGGGPCPRHSLSPPAVPPPGDAATERLAQMREVVQAACVERDAAVERATRLEEGLREQVKTLLDLRDRHSDSHRSGSYAYEHAAELISALTPTPASTEPEACGADDVGHATCERPKDHDGDHQGGPWRWPATSAAPTPTEGDSDDG